MGLSVPDDSFPHYPVEMARVSAVEPKPPLRASVGRVAADVALDVWVVDGVADYRLVHG